MPIDMNWFDNQVKSLKKQRQIYEQFSRVLQKILGQAVRALGIPAIIQVRAKEITRIPRNTVSLSADEARKVLRLLETLDDHDDVQNVSANFDVPEEVLAEMG